MRSARPAMENSNSAGGRRRGTTKHSAEDQALDQIAKEVSFFVMMNISPS